MRVGRVFFFTIFGLAGVVAALTAPVWGQDSAGPNPMAGRSSLYLPALSTGKEQDQALGGLATAPVPPAEQEATAAFWTRERMLAATSLDMLELEDRAAEGEAWRDTGQPGPKGAVPGTLPNPKAEALAKTLYAAEWAQMNAPVAADEVLPTAGIQAAAADEATAYASAPPFVSYYVNDNSPTWKSFPWITMGRLFFQIPGQAGTYACTGAAAHGRAVWTAGHCIYTAGRGWSYNMYFVPAYRNGNYPYGSFVVNNRTALQAWVAGGNLAYDIGMVAVNDKNGMKLSQWVGSIGFMWSQTAKQMFHAFGYPGNYSSGQYLVACAAGTYERDPLNGPDPIGIGCDMGSGASGGPWIVGYAPFKGGATNYINGLVSYSYATKPQVVYGPYFGEDARVLYEWAKMQ